MKNEFTRRGVLAGLTAILGTAARPEVMNSSLRPVLRGEGFEKRAVPAAAQIVSEARLDGLAHFAVADLRSGQILEQIAADQHAIPASVTKTVTALYALETLGGDHRFATRVIATGGIVDGVVQGDLILKGGCDPTLDTDDLNALAAGVAEAGIREVRGRFLVNDGALPEIARVDSGQPEHLGYNPTVSGIALNFNRVHFEWRRAANGYGVTMDARTEYLRPEVSMARMKVENRDLPVYTYASTSARDEWTVARGALGKGGARWLPVRKPALYAGDVFRTLMRSRGCVLPAAERSTAPVNGETLSVHFSAPLEEMLRAMLKYSNNLIAEMVGLSATQRRIGTVTDLASSAAEMTRWAQTSLGMTHSAFVDHSGLGDRSQMTAADMVQVLIKVEQTGFRDMLKPIRLRDRRGRPNPEHPVSVNAKTGTLNFVSCLAGYLTGPDGTQMAFAIMSADPKRRAALARHEREAPPGGKNWTARARRMQQALIERWATVHGT